MPKLSEYIKVLSDFQYSINIGADLFADEKIINYIPTTSALELIEDVMLSLNDNSNDRARIFTGAYGKGKSHLALVLVSLLYRKEKFLFENILEKIKEYRIGLYNLVYDYINSDKKLLPVIIQGSGLSIRQSLMSELKKALSNIGLENLMPDTYFKAAITTIESWKSDYISVYTKFAKEINCSVSDYIAELKQYNVDYYNNFTKIYKELSAGAEFNPVSAMSVIDLYTNVAEKVKEHGYNGIFVIYDEFSKYLQGNARRETGDDFKALQDFAELCTRSKNKQLHIMLISHQSIINYYDKDISKTKIDEWKAVSNRFKSVELNNSASQMYQIISHVIMQKAEWFKKFVASNQSKFDEVSYKWGNHRAFAELTDAEKHNLVYDCYPLEPITTYLLPRVSERIAQNERTIFTFLSASGQKNTLNSFLNQNDDNFFPVLTPDFIFDYFEPLFKAEGYDKPIHKIWKTTMAALNKLMEIDIVEKKMIKAIAVIYILNQFEILPPDTDTLISIFNGSVYDMNIVIKAINNLTQQKIVAKPTSKNYLRITEHTEVNVEELIENQITQIAPNSSIKTILNSFSGDRVLYPNAYNDSKEIVRYFNFEFITTSEIRDVKDWNLKISAIDGDGIVYAVIPESDNIDGAITLVRGVDNPRIVFITPIENSDIYHEAIKYQAVRTIIEDEGNEQDKDIILIEELTYTLDDLIERLNNYVEMYIRPELGLSRYFYRGNCENIKRCSALSHILSNICENTFHLCPIINNENINKNMITSQAYNSRSKVIDGLLQNEVLEDLGLFGTGQDISFMRSTIKATGVLTRIEGKSVLNIQNLEDENLEGVLNAIKAFILRSSADNQALCFREIYDLLTLPEYHIGLKKGVIPIYIACVLHFYKKYVVVTSRKREIEITAKLLESVNENPDNYYIYLEQWDTKKENYINALEKLFSKYTNTYEKEYNNFEYIVKSMQRWFMALPKYTKEIENRYVGNGNFEKIDVTILKLKNALKAPEINSREFLFDKLPWIYESKDLNTVIINMANSKTLLDETKHKLIQIFELELSEIFKNKPNNKVTLTSIILDWCESLDEKIFSHLFNGSESSLLSLCKDITPDTNRFVEDIARAATGLRIDDWNQITISDFITAITKFKETIDNYNTKANTYTSEGKIETYKISIISEDGVESYKTFDKAEYSDKAELFYNDEEALLEEFGESLSPNEKRQVLIDIINNLLG